MRYQDSVAQGAEFLRLALPLMSRNSLAPHPVNYAVWYEFVSGRNVSLKNAVDALNADAVALTDDLMTELYDKHIASAQEKLVSSVNASLVKTLAEAQSSTAEAEQQAASFGNLLAESSDKLEEAMQNGPMDDFVRGTLASARMTAESLASLEHRLKDVSGEVANLQAALARAQGEALTDALTEAANRKGFDQALNAALREKCAGKFRLCLIMADIDFFKKINDSYGHVFGDRVIKGVAQIMKLAVKGQDMVARYGGEEFAVILPDTPLTGAMAVAEQIRSTIANSKVRVTTRNEIVSNITASFGVACYRVGESVESFIARADAALYQSKHNGRNQVSIEIAASSSPEETLRRVRMQPAMEAPAGVATAA